MLGLTLGLLFGVSTVSVEATQCPKVCTKYEFKCHWEGWHLKCGNECVKEERVCTTPTPAPTSTPEPTSVPEPTPTVEPEVTPTPVPDSPWEPGNCHGCDEKPTAYQCPNGKVLEVPQALFVHRAGTEATVTWFRTAGDQATILYRETGTNGWQHALRDIQNKDWNSYTIYALNPVLGYDFGVYQHQGCGDGNVVVPVVVDDPTPTTFSFSHWELVK